MKKKLRKTMKMIMLKKTLNIISESKIDSSFIFIIYTITTCIYNALDYQRTN